jgi:hypothetical protein
MGNHQIAVHTWSHTALTTQTNEEIIAELGWSKKVIKDVLGVTPNMMRPPYGDIEYVLFLVWSQWSKFCTSDRVRAISIAMGLTPVIWTRISPTATFDTGGRSRLYPTCSQTSHPICRLQYSRRFDFCSASVEQLGIHYRQCYVYEQRFHRAGTRSF